MRVAALWQQIETKNAELSIDGNSPGLQLELIRQEVTVLMEEIYRVWREEIRPGVGTMQDSDPGGRSVDRSPVESGGRLFPPHRLSGINAAGRRSRPAISAHFKPQPERGGSGQQRRRD